MSEKIEAVACGRCGLKPYKVDHFYRCFGIFECDNKETHVLDVWNAKQISLRHERVCKLANEMMKHSARFDDRDDTHHFIDYESAYDAAETIIDFQDAKHRELRGQE